MAVLVRTVDHSVVRGNNGSSPSEENPFNRSSSFACGHCMAPIYGYPRCGAVPSLGCASRDRHGSVRQFARQRQPFRKHPDSLKRSGRKSRSRLQDGCRWRSILAAALLTSHRRCGNCSRSHTCRNHAQFRVRLRCQWLCSDLDNKFRAGLAVSELSAYRQPEKPYLLRTRGRCLECGGR